MSGLVVEGWPLSRTQVSSQMPFSLGLQTLRLGLSCCFSGKPLSHPSLLSPVLELSLSHIVTKICPGRLLSALLAMVFPVWALACSGRCRHHLLQGFAFSTSITRPACLPLFSHSCSKQEASLFLYCPVVGLGACQATSLCPSSFICKMGIIINREIWWLGLKQSHYKKKQCSSLGWQAGGS